jgi:beta-aspartyl-dipeptidase (metallo-type)
MALQLIKNATVYSPHKMGKYDVLIAEGKIVYLAEQIDLPELSDVVVTMADGMIMIPGIIDAHVHIAGAGGEGGPASRTPELQLTDYTTAGVTTVVGCLGTDGITRSVESVLMRAKGLTNEAITAYIYTGSYQVPTTTITGDVARDLSLIQEVVGVGEVAISDHRSSVPSLNELIRIAAQARVGGMLGGKAGIVNLHMGDAQNPFQPIHDAVANSQLSYRQFLPTHCNRNFWIFEDALIYGKKGYVDITTSSYPYYADEEVKPSTALRKLLEAGVPQEHITFTSDAGGSLPGFDPISGELTSMVTATPHANLREMVDAVLNEGIPLEQALLPLTLNPARILKLASKGRIEVGCDADLLLLNIDFKLISVMAKGKWFVIDGQAVVKGSYER